MKQLKKMLLINWYYIDHQIINFDTTNFMTGKNGAGKSTIIDAMQIVMLGDTRNTFFNKAANEKGGRTLDGYLRGEITDNGETGKKTVREGRFSSYIALEFFDTVERKSFTCGIVFDSYKDAKTEHMFFILQDVIPENHFINQEEKTPMNYRELKNYFASNYGKNKYTTYKESNKSYQKDFLAKMGGLKPKFFNLFKKSVTFTPISDIEEFISEYVCDVTDEINIEKMQENIRNYKQLEKEALSMQERQRELELIENLFKTYQIDAQNEYMQSFLSKKSTLQIEENKLKEIRDEFDNNLKEIEVLEKKKEEINEKKDNLSKLRDAKIIEVDNSDVGRKQKELEQKIETIKEKLNDIDKETKRVIDGFRNKIATWRVNIKKILEEKTITNGEILELANNLKDNIEYLLSINENNLETIDENALPDIKGQMEAVNRYTNELLGRNNVKEEQIKENKERLKKEIANLKIGIKPYETNLISLKENLQKELQTKFNENVPVEILADLLEIVDLKWKKAVECYMNSQMFYLIVAPKYYSEAAKIFRRLVKENNYDGFGIVDIEKIKNDQYILVEKSLAEEITTDNEFAKIYIDYLLGRIIKCEDTEEMRKYKSAITADCMLYKNYVLRKISDKNNRFNFIGKKSIDEQIKNKENELETISIELQKLEQIKETLNGIEKAEKFSGEEVRYILNDIYQIRNKGKLVEEKEKAIEELDKLDLSWVQKVRDEIKTIEDEISTLNKSCDENNKKQTTTETRNQYILGEKIPDAERKTENQIKEIQNAFSEKWINEFGNPKFEEEKEKTKLETIRKRAEEQIAKIQDQKERKEVALIKARTDYVRKYDSGYNVLSKDTNKYFSKKLQEIKEVALPQYLDKIKDSKEKAYEQFRDDFLSKLKANIDEVENQVEELNNALKNSTFGTDKYHFSVKPKQAYKQFYNMIKDNMLMEGRNLWSEEFNQKYKTEIEELFGKLTSSDTYGETCNKNIETYTDYKTYLSFDLVVTDKEGEVQHLSRTLDKKSGGETQTPFYISVLASFAQLYRINKNRNDNTLRLIIFDEAFSKMDEDRIEESLSLLPKFGFQGIIAAPTERAGEITPLVRNTLCVIKKGKKTVVREWGMDKSYIG